MNRPPHVPCYVYDQRTIENACAALTDNLPGVDLLYSIKANPFPPVVRLMAGQGFGADAASADEVALALRCGVKPGNIYYSSPGKTAQDVQCTIGCCVLVADSLNELRLIDTVASQRGEAAQVGIRVHPDFSMDGSPTTASKFGIDMDCVDQLASLLPTLSHVQVAGVHVHLMSQILYAAKLAAYYKNVMNLALRLRDRLGIRMSFVNFGSGIGVAYDDACEQPVDLTAIGQAFGDIRRANELPGARLLIETGRYVVCRAGRYVTQVVDRKRSHGQTYLVVQGGLNGFMRPAIAHLLGRTADLNALNAMEPLFTSAHQCRIRVLNDDPVHETVTIAGNLCTAMDVIGQNITVNRAAVGDLVQVTNTGSYGYSLSPLYFASQCPPMQYLLTPDGQYVCHVN